MHLYILFSNFLLERILLSVLTYRSFTNKKRFEIAELLLKILDPDHARAHLVWPFIARYTCDGSSRSKLITVYYSCQILKKLSVLYVLSVIFVQVFKFYYIRKFIMNEDYQTIDAKHHTEVLKKYLLKTWAISILYLMRVFYQKMPKNLQYLQHNFSCSSISRADNTEERLEAWSKFFVLGYKENQIFENNILRSLILKPLQG